MFVYGNSSISIFEKIGILEDCDLDKNGVVLFARAPPAHTHTDL